MPVNAQLIYLLCSNHHHFLSEIFLWLLDVVVAVPVFILGCFSFNVIVYNGQPLQNLSVTPGTFLFADAPARQWCPLIQSLKTREQISKYFLDCSWNKNIFFYFLMQEEQMDISHGCSLWSLIWNIWFPKYFLQHCSELNLQSSFVRLKEQKALSDSHLFFLRCSAGV